jgi:hypothetical protein
MRFFPVGIPWLRCDRAACREKVFSFRPAGVVLTAHRTSATPWHRDAGTVCIIVAKAATTAFRASSTYVTDLKTRKMWRSVPGDGLDGPEVPPRCREQSLCYRGWGGQPPGFLLGGGHCDTYFLCIPRIGYLPSNIACRKTCASLGLNSSTNSHFTTVA